LEIAFRALALQGIEAYEVVQVLAGVGGPRRVVPAFSPQGLPVRSIWGRTAAGRALIVVVRAAGGFDSVIIGAREMSDAEREGFESWESQ
jgi:hypothetical protein